MKNRESAATDPNRRCEDPFRQPGIRLAAAHLRSPPWMCDRSLQLRAATAPDRSYRRRNGSLQRRAACLCDFAAMQLRFVDARLRESVAASVQ
jgi:hypothetical protein